MGNPSEADGVCLSRLECISGVVARCGSWSGRTGGGDKDVSAALDVGRDGVVLRL